MREFKKGADGVEIVNLREPPTIHGTVLNDHAFKMYHSLLIHLKHYLRLIKKALRAKVDLTAHLSEMQINEIRTNWNTFMAKGKDIVILDRKMYTMEDRKIILEELERAYLGPPPEKMSEKQRKERRAELFEVAESRKSKKIVNYDTRETKEQLNETIARQIGDMSVTRRSLEAVKKYVNVNIFETYQIRRKGIISAFAEENPSKENLSAQREIVERALNHTNVREQREKVEKYVHALLVEVAREELRR